MTRGMPSFDSALKVGNVFGAGKFKYPDNKTGISAVFVIDNNVIIGGETFAADNLNKLFISDELEWEIIVRTVSQA